MIASGCVVLRQAGGGIQAPGLHRGLRELQHHHPLHQEAPHGRRHRLRGVHHQQVINVTLGIIDDREHFYGLFPKYDNRY